MKKLVLENVVGTIPNTGESVKEIKEIRRKLSNQKFNLNQINQLSE